MDSRIIEWDGSHVPDELRALPPGRYVVEPLSAPLTAGEMQGIRDAMDELDAGLGIPFEEVMRELEGDLDDLERESQ
jgi:hypothetical protein